MPADLQSTKRLANGEFVRESTHPITIEPLNTQKRRAAAVPPAVKLAVVGMIAAIALFGSQNAHATTYTWNTTTSGALWSGSGSWVGNAVPTFVAGDTFDLSTLNINAATTSTMDTAGGNTLGTIKIGDSNTSTNASWTLGLSTALTLDGNGSAATINQISTSKGDTINGAGGIILASDLNTTNASGNTLNISTAITATGATRTITNNGGGNGQVNFNNAIGAGINLVQNSTTSGTFLGATSSSFNGTIAVKAGFLSMGTTGAAIGLGTGSIILGDTSGSSNATLFLNSINGQGYSASITVASGSSGIKSIVGAVNSGNNTNFINSSITLGPDSSHTADLTVGNSTNSTSTWQVRGAITGFGNLTVKTTNTGRTHFTTASSINNTGTLTNAGTSSGAAQIDAVVGANVTGVVQNSSTSQMNLNAANTYTGVTIITLGTLNVNSLANGGSNSNIGASTNVAGNLILNGGTLQYAGGAVSTDRLFSLQSSSTIDASGSSTGVNFTNTGSMGFNGGTAAKTLTLTGTNTGANTLAAVIGDNTGATSVTKTGAGKWTLTGANTYTGITTIQAGTVALVAAASTNNIASSTKILVGDTFANNSAGLTVTGLSGGGITLGGTQTLAGFGTVTGNVTGVSGSTVGPGNSNGQLTVAGNFTLGAGKLNIQLDKTTSSQITTPSQQTISTVQQYDQLIVSGSNTVNVTGGALVLEVGQKLVAGDVYYILDNQGSGSNGTFTSGSINGTGATIALISGSTYSFSTPTYNFTLNYAALVSGTANDISLTAVTVPEPGTCGALLGMASAGLLSRRRRKLAV